MLRMMILVVWVGCLSPGAIASDGADSPLTVSQVPESYSAATAWNDWSKLPSTALRTDISLGTPAPDPQDISGRVTLAWNSKFFFVVMRATDDVFRPSDSMTDFWNGDSIQFAFDPLGDTVNGTDNNDIMVGAVDLPFGKKVLPTQVPDDLPQGVWDVPFEVKHEGSIVTYVVALPWRYCGQLSPLRDRPFRFNAIVNDNDSGKRKGYLKLTDGIGDGPNASIYRSAAFAYCDDRPAIYAVVERQKVQKTDCVKVIVHTRNLSSNSLVQVSSGKYVAEKKAPSSAFGELAFLVPAKKLVVGESLINVKSKPSGVEDTVAVTVIDPEAKTSRLAECRAIASQIERLLVSERARGRAVDRYQLRLNVLNRAFCVVDLAHRGYVQDGKTITYPKISENVTGYIDAAAPKLLADVKAFVNDSSAPQFTVPQPDLYQTWSVKKGNLYAGDTPIVISGWLWQYLAKDSSYKLSEVGLNIQSIEPGPNAVMSEPFKIDPDLLTNDLIRNCRSYVAQGQRSGEVFDILAGPHYLPQWFKPGGEGDYAWMNTAEGERLLDLLYQAHAKAFGEYKSIKTYDLANEWIFCNQSPEAMKDFRNWLQKKHKSIKRVNQLWEASFNSFEDIPKPYDEKKIFVPVGVYQHRGAFWDWCNFNAERAASVVKWMNDTSKKRYPGLLTHIKCIFSSVSHRSMAQCFVVGTDPQQILPITDLIGLDGSYIRGYNWLDTLFVYDYVKSICPDKPIFCSEMHTVPYDDETTAGDIRRGLFQRFVHGERAYMLFLNTTSQIPEWWGNSEAGYDWNLSAHPVAMESFVLTSADLQRLASPISHFADEPVSVQLFYDKAADFGIPGKADSIADQYFQRARIAYAALLGHDVRVGILTENRLAQKPVKEKLIILAGAHYVRDETVEALKNYLKQGGMILWWGENLQFDEYGRERDPKILEEFNRLQQVIRIEETIPNLTKMLKVILRKAGIIPAFVATSSTGGPVADLEIRSTVDEKGQPIVFLANTHHTSQNRLTLRSSDGTNDTWIDLITGREISEKTITIPANDVLLLTPKR
jgi:hypothetical protein